MAEATLLISSKNYSSWCLRGWLITRLSGLPFREEFVAVDNAAVRAELLLRSSSILVPTLVHDGVTIWDTLAISEYLNELRPEAQMIPADRQARARCRAICGEMHSGFSALRSSLPMNLHAHRPGFVIWSAARADIDRILSIWDDCLTTWKGPYLFGERLSVADAMYAPVVTRFLTYDVKLDERAARYCRDIMAWPDMADWVAAAKEEPQEITELEVEF
ncbi:glutathione S-transferase family protein [Acidisoma sp.]|uniref:glutathione S-transferase family protein n=1 Tax=Acidisoma sp. TaxID=1872115 RepID=UPI003B005DBE